MDRFCMSYLNRQLRWVIPAMAIFSSHTVMAEAKGTVNPTIITQTALPESFGLLEASAQYRIEYPSTDGVKGEGSRIDTAAVFLPKGPTPLVDGLSSPGHTGLQVLLTIVLRR